MKLRPLPDQVDQLLRQHSAPPRLMAHLTLTHHVAAELLPGIRARWPSLPLDDEAVLFGAAIHDIGKCLHPEELSRPGHHHETAGETLLMDCGVEPGRARFCRTHGNWKNDSPLEDLLVALADKIWKGKRDEDLEDAVTDRIVLLSGEERWKVYMALDDALTELAKNADARLRWQSEHPRVASPPGEY